MSGAAATACALVMARAPVPGSCKTRLEPRLGPDGCAALQAALLGHAAGWAADVAGAGRGVACVAADPPDGIDAVAALAPRADLVFAQEGPDLGARIAAAVARVLGLPGVAGPLLVVGTDLPVLGAEHAAEALADLDAGADVVLGPAADGGYWLVGLRTADPAPFALPADVWGTGEVLASSVAASRAAGLATVVLDRVEHDLDVPADADLALADPRTPAAIRAALGAPA